jgi:hypothetical protein
MRPFLDGMHVEVQTYYGREGLVAFNAEDGGGGCC